MSIAALYDIHGNLPALEAVLEEVRSLKVAQIDVVRQFTKSPSVPQDDEVILVVPGGGPLLTELIIAITEVRRIAA